MSARHKRMNFRKKDYVNMVRSVAQMLSRYFGYNTPHIREGSLPKNSLMAFATCDNFCWIAYDYQQFQRLFRNQPRQFKMIYVACITAHEMRHYYQYRQMRARRPRESGEVIARWRENEACQKQAFESMEEYLYQPLELDASLFEYIFAAKLFRIAYVNTLVNLTHYEALERLYIEYHGESNECLFNDDVRAFLCNRE